MIKKKFIANAIDTNNVTIDANRKCINAGRSNMSVNIDIGLRCVNTDYKKGAFRALWSYRS